MPAFSSVARSLPLKEKRGALRKVEVPPSAFQDGWPDKPSRPAQVGLRLIADKDIQLARSTASKRAFDRHPHGPYADPDWLDAHNDALVRWVVARATCLPDDITQAYFTAAEETVEIALTADGARFLYEQIEILAIEESPLSPEATDEDLVDLIALIGSGAAWGHMPVGRAQRLRRLLGHAIEELARYERGVPELVVEGN